MRKKKELKLHLKIIILVVLIPILSFSLYTFSKYILTEFHSYFLNSKNFYFTSNRLKENTALYQINNWSGSGSFTISFDLLSSKNSYLYTDYDIPYTVNVSCPTGVSCSVDKPTGTIYSSSTDHKDTVTVSVNPSGSYSENESITVNISATSTSPYVKTISANYQYIVGKKGVTYEIEDEANRAYLIFKVTNSVSYCTVVNAFSTYQTGDTIDNRVFKTLSDSDKLNCISQVIELNFNPNDLLLDTTSNILSEASWSNTTINGVDYISYLKFNVNSLSTESIKFYKINPANNYTYPIVNNRSIIDVTVSDPT